MLYQTFFLLISTDLIALVNAKAQYVQPLVGGMQVAIPYDIANIFNKPVLFGSISGVILSFALLSILFFGVITSPFGYMFGIPSEKYVMGGPFSSTDPQLNSRRSRGFGTVENLGDGNDDAIPGSSYPDFMDTVFRWVADVRDPECQKLILCHAHGAVGKLPKSMLTGYQFFSRKIVQIPDEFKKAIHNGLKGRKSCEAVYATCPEGIFGIVVRSAIKLMPKWTRRKALKPDSYF